LLSHGKGTRTVASFARWPQKITVCLTSEGKAGWRLHMRK